MQHITTDNNIISKLVFLLGAIQQSLTASFYI